MVKLWPSVDYFILLYILYLWHSPPFWWKVEKCQICHLYHFRCRHIKLILIGPINGPFTPRVSCSNWIHMFGWHQMSSSKKSFRLLNLVQLCFCTLISQKQVWICPLKQVWWPVLDLDVQDDGWICEMTFVFVGPSQIWDHDMCTGYLVVICRTVLLLHLHNVSYNSHT